MKTKSLIAVFNLDQNTAGFVSCHKKGHNQKMSLLCGGSIIMPFLLHFDIVVFHI